MADGVQNSYRLPRSPANNDAYVFLFALNAFQYSHTDDRLTRDDWEQFQKKEAPIPYALPAVLAQRIVTYALENWPEWAVVD